MKNARYFSISVAVLILDQLTKWAIIHSSVVERPYEILPGYVRFAYGENTGALFGMFAGLEQPWRTVVLLIVPLAAIGLVLFFMRVSGEKDRLALMGLALILGGAVGNQMDRLLRHGGVIDFVDVSLDAEPLRGWLVRTFGSSHWPAFNVADSSIVVGAIILAFDLLRQTKPRAGTRAKR